MSPEEVYEPTERVVVAEAPEDLAGWLRKHPYLRTSPPEPATVGGVGGERLDLVVGEVPEGHSGVCGRGCVDLFRTTDAESIGIVEGIRVRAIVLEEVRGETVIAGFGAPSDEFDGFAPEAQKVIGTVEWGS